MQKDDEVAAISAPDRFDRLPRRTRALLLALLMFAASAVTFLLSLHEYRAGEPLVNMAGKSDYADGFLISAGAFLLGIALLAASFGWLKNAKPLDAKTPPR